MARRGRLFPDLGISAPSVVARMLAWARDGTDFRPSRSGGATVPVAAHSLRACQRGMAHQRRRSAGFRDSVNSHFNLHPLHALTNANLISASYLQSLVDDISDSPDSPKDCFYGQFGRLTSECRARATRGAYTHPIGHIHLVQVSTLGIEGRQDRWSGDSGHGTTTNERRRHLTAIRELAT